MRNLVVCVVGLLGASLVLAQQADKGNGMVTGSLTYGGKTHTVQAQGSGTDSGRSIYKLQLADGTIVFSDRQPAGAKIIDTVPVVSTSDANIVAHREREYWRAREKELNQRIDAEREQEASRRRLANQRAAEQAQREGFENGSEVLILRGVRVARINNGVMPQGFAPYTSTPGVGGRIASAASGR
jgi:hypothetical protein